MHEWLSDAPRFIFAPGGLTGNALRPIHSTSNNDKSMSRKLIRRILDGLPYVGGLRAQLRNVGGFPAGHFYSPIPTRTEIETRLQFLKRMDDRLPGIDLRTEQQREILRTFQRFYGELPFRDEKTEDLRYYFDQTVFCHADAIFLYSFLRHIQPQRIIEVGSGFSSAVMLDTVERFFEQSPQITFIEPFPVNLKRLLRPRDFDRISFIEDRVQAVPIERFRSLAAGDLLFIDSSHVMKCGSDLQFLMFDVLPHLPKGVFVHFHDVFPAFEYPQDWLVKGWYWNEDYVLRAFLSYNSAWEIYWFGSYAVGAFRSLVRETMPLCLKNPGGSLYIRRIA